MLPDKQTLGNQISSRRQELHYRIYVLNQTDQNPFNRAMLFNVGFVEAMKDHNWTCVIFHDVDLIPEDDRNVYRSSTQILVSLRKTQRKHSILVRGLWCAFKILNLTSADVRPTRGTCRWPLTSLATSCLTQQSLEEPLHSRQISSGIF